MMRAKDAETAHRPSITKSIRNGDLNTIVCDYKRKTIGNEEYQLQHITPVQCKRSKSFCKLFACKVRFLRMQETILFVKASDLSQDKSALMDSILGIETLSSLFLKDSTTYSWDRVCFILCCQWKFRVQYITFKTILIHKAREFKIQLKQFLVGRFYYSMPQD